MTDSILNPSEDVQVRHSKPKKSSNFTRNILVTIGALSLLGLGGLGVLAIAKEKPELLGLNNEASKSEGDAQKELEALIAEVGRIIELPSGESPTLATVTDLEQVKNQPFFAKAKNGDRVLVYANAKKAILYRPSDKKIIEVGVVNMGQTAGQSVTGAPEKIDIASPSVSPTAVPTRTNPPTLTPVPTSAVTPNP